MTLAVISSAIAGKLNDAVEALEQLMLEHDQVEIPAVESYKNGLYSREITIPAGTLLTGRVWLDDYIDIMVSGHIVVATADGVKELKGYNVCDGAAGRKRAGYAVEDTKWITVHKACESDTLDTLSRFSMAQYKVAKAQQHYLQVFGPIAELIAEQSAATSDFKSVPATFESLIEVRESPVHGLGLFAKQLFKAGDHIAPARICGYRTEAGRYSNHSCFPNAVMQAVGKNIALIASQDINAGEEILTDYVHTLHVVKEAI